MALSTDLKICFDCCHDRIKVTDNTGTYSSVDNEGGWDDTSVVNPALTDVTSSLLYVTDPNGTTEILDFPEGSFMFVTPGVTLNTSAVANSLAFSDGEWTFKWIVIAGSTYTKTLVSGNSCIVAACVDDKLASLDPGCGCDGRNLQNVVKAKLYLDGLRAAWGCGKYEKANALLERLQEMCSNDCKDC